MASRKKNKKKVEGFMLPVKFAGALVVVAALALGHIWMESRCEALGREIKEFENENAALKKKYSNEESKWSRMKAPRNLERVLREHNIAMTWPRRDQIVRLYDAGQYQSGYARLDRVVMNE